MSREELALETQLLLQEVTQATQYAAVAAPESDAPPLTELERAKLALVDKLRKKKEQQRQQRQQINMKRYGFAGSSVASAAAAPASQAQPQPQAASSGASPRVLDRLTPVKQKKMAKLPVIAGAPVTTKKKKDLLHQLRHQAIKQGAQEMAKLFGYSSYEEQIKHLNKIEKMKILQNEMLESGAQQKDENAPVIDVDEQEAQQKDENAPVIDVDEQEGGEQDELDDEAAAGEDDEQNATELAIEVDDEADSEKDENGGDDDDEDDDKEQSKNRDRAAAFRQLLQAEAAQTRNRKRLRKGGGDFVEDEAEEEEEEDVLKIGGLGDFGFGVPQAATKETKEAEEERNALNFREDDLEGIVDDLSDDERAQEHDLQEIVRRETEEQDKEQEIVRRETEEQDKEQVREVMRKVKEGFGRNRRAFSAGLDGGAGARGRFNLSELVAADGDKLEAARLGLLESDEELNDDDEDGVNAEGGEKEEAEEEEEDEEAEMERMLRDRFLNQPKIYITSSESENEDENEVDKDGADDTAAEELESDEERERQQMKLFSEKARINRRMQRMKEAQRLEEAEEEELSTHTQRSAARLEEAEEEELSTHTQRSAAVPNLLLEEDEDSQALLNVLKRTDAAATNSAQPHRKQVAGVRRPALGRFNSFGMSGARSASSFSRVADNCKLFTGGSSTSTAKGFVFTAALGADRGGQQTDENEAATVAADDDSSFGGEAVAATAPSLSKSKSFSGSTRGSHASSKRPFATAGTAAAAPRKKQKSGFFSVLASFQAMPSGSSAPTL
ncbi:hypothetical protein P43SY_000663 [Pythium insidiosum]|uniref:DNA replication checkpoint mediator MRC1 domain-containing protein n=1 Tax=Pythium insidiosum TaxID=114742 RepID=A0AAD5M643_PYTIN|nr:hypothetical protein P43SY_000663 [Pythium insidiosum]